MRAEAARKPIWMTVIGVALVIGMVISIGNELANTPIDTPGWASLTRPIHAFLGLGALLWAIGGFAFGRYLLIGGLVTAIPVLGFDWSRELVDPLMSLQWAHVSKSSTSFSHNAPNIGRYQSRGINVAPLLIGLLFAVCYWKQALPLLPGLRQRAGARRFDTFCVTILLLPLIVGVGVGVHFWSAPYLIWATEPGVRFFHKQEALGSRYLRVTPSLMNRLGLDGTTPSDQWDIRLSPYARHVVISDGNVDANIHVTTSDTGRGALPIETPWGRRSAVYSGSGTAQQGRVHWIRPYRNPRFEIRPGPIRHAVTAGEPFSTPLRITAHGPLPSFHEMRVRSVFFPLNVAAGSYPKRNAGDRYTPAPPVFRKLNDHGRVRGTVQIIAPHRPGTYQLMTIAWLRDDNGDYARPIRSLGYSSFIVVQVKSSAPAAKGRGTER